MIQPFDCQMRAGDKSFEKYLKNIKNKYILTNIFILYTMNKNYLFKADNEKYNNQSIMAGLLFLF